MDYDNDDIEQDSGDLSNIEGKSPGFIDSATQSATHMAGKALAEKYAPGVGGKLYEAASRTKVGQAIEKKVAKHFSFKVKMTILGISICCFLLFFIVYAFFIHDGLFDSDSGNVCINLPSIDNVCKSITPDGYETMSVDEYVAGVINGEVAAYIDSDYNTYKALAIAARSYVLVRSSKDSNGNCTVPVGPSFQNYVPNPSQEMINAVEETSGVVLVKDNSLYDSEYDALCIDSEDDENYYLCQGGEGEEHLVLPISWVQDNVIPVMGENYVETIREQVHGRGMSQNGAWYLALDRGWDYVKILEYFYGDDGVTLASINGSTSNCNSSFNGNFSPLETYNLNHDGLDVLNRTLTDEEQDNLNNYINSEVDKAGYGTGAGVAAAGQALTYWLEQQGYYLQYRWGGGHYNSADENGGFVGVNPNWGSTSFGIDWNSGSPRYYWGMDCSGFVSWAVRTACKPNDFNVLAGCFYYDYPRSNCSYYNFGPDIELKDAKPGDLIDNDVHVKLVIKNNGDGTVIAAEERGSPLSGLIFSLVTDSSGYHVVDMSDWYNNNCDSSR